MILALIIASLSGTLVRFGKANPSTYPGEGWMGYNVGEVPVPEGMENPKIVFSSPKENETYTTNSIPLIFNVTTSLGTLRPTEYMFCLVDYKGSWQSNSTHVNDQHASYVNINLTDVPRGAHSILVTANLEFQNQSWIDENRRWISYYTSYKMNCSETVHFNVEPPFSISESFSILTNDLVITAIVVVLFVAWVLAAIIQEKRS